VGAHRAKDGVPGGIVQRNSGGPALANEQLAGLFETADRAEQAPCTAAIEQLAAVREDLLDVPEAEVFIDERHGQDDAVLAQRIGLDGLGDQVRVLWIGTGPERPLRLGRDCSYLVLLAPFGLCSRLCGFDKLGEVLMLSGRHRPAVARPGSGQTELPAAEDAGRPAVGVQTVPAVARSATIAIDMEAM
jgi:hypothetical protein